MSRFLSLKYGTVLAVVLLLVTLNSTLLFFSQLLQQSNAKLYHHGEGKSYMNVNIASNYDEEEEEDGKKVLSPTSVLGATVGSLAAVVDNISGKNQEYVMSSPPVDIVYTWVNGSDPRQIEGSSAQFTSSFFPVLSTHF